MPVTGWRGTRREIAPLLILAVTWLALWRVAALMEYAPHASIWFPPAGLTFAALLVLGFRAIPALMVCAVLVTYWADAMYDGGQSAAELFEAGIYFGIAHCSTYWAGAATLRWLIRRWAHASLPLLVIGFLVLGAVSSLAASVLGVQALVIGGMVSRGEAAAIILPWWIGDMAGVLILAPLFVGLLSWRYPSLGRWFGGLIFTRLASGRYGFLGKLLLCSGILVGVMIAAAAFRHPYTPFAVFFLIIPVMWIVYTESALRTSLSLAALSVVMAILVSALGLSGDAMVYQFALTVIATNAWFGMTVPALAQHNQVLKRQVSRDALTGVAARNHFMALAQAELVRAGKMSTPLSLIVFDLDDFKTVNDLLGHTAGDQVLQAVAETAAEGLAPTEMLGRFGGDEFMVLLPGRDQQAATRVAERMRQSLAGMRVPGIDATITGSFGIAEAEEEESVEVLFMRADAALLTAKREGRDRFAVAE